MADFDGNGVPDIVWMNSSTRQVTVNYYGGAGGATLLGWAYLNSAGELGWTVVGAGDFDGNGTPDLVWENDSTNYVVVDYYGGSGGATLLGYNWLSQAANTGWRVAAVADFDRNGTPDLIWMNTSTRQVTAHYYSGVTDIGWAWLNVNGNPGWTLVGANDYDGNGVPDLVWENDSTQQVQVQYYGGPSGSAMQGWNWMNSSGSPGWTAIVPIVSSSALGSAPPLSLSCAASPNPVTSGQVTTFQASPSGGTAPYTSYHMVGRRPRRRAERSMAKRRGRKLHRERDRNRLGGAVERSYV